MLKLMTTEGLISAFTAKLLFGAVRVILEREVVLDLVRGLRPWNEMLDGVRLWWCFWMVGVKSKLEVAIAGACLVS